MTMPFRMLRLSLTFLCFIFSGVLLLAQSSSTSPASPDQQDPLKRPLSAKKRDAHKKELQQYEKWLKDTPVSLIITDEERGAFLKLSNNAERDNFIEQFWVRRDPTPDTSENEYKEEYDRRVAYANEHFAAGTLGWKTDRGRIYIIHGAPDSIDSHPMGGPYQRTAEEGGGETSTYPFEIWRYRHLDGIGEELEIEFVDTCNCGAYHMTLDRGEKDAFSNVPNAGPTLMESMGMVSKADRSRGIETSGRSLFGNNRESKEFERMEQLAKLESPSPIKYTSLREGVLITMRYGILPFDVRVDFAKADASTVAVPVTIQVPNGALTYIEKDKVYHASVNVYGQVTTLTGKVVSTFEDPVRLDVPAELLEKTAANVSLYQQTLPLRPGHYRLDIVLKDVNSGKTGLFARSIIVPDFTTDDKLAASSLIVADLIEPVRPRDAGPGSFMLGASRVRPRVAPQSGDPATFLRGEKVNLWMQVYNLGLDSGAKPSASIEYQVVNAATNQPVIQLTETSERLDTAGNQITLRKSLPPDKLTSGLYLVTIKVNDIVSQQSVSTSAKFAVK